MSVGERRKERSRKIKKKPSLDGFGLGKGPAIWKTPHDAGAAFRSWLAMPPGTPFGRQCVIEPSR
jgi:hypothetical protein